MKADDMTLPGAVAYIDGGCEPNPGRGAWATVGEWNTEWAHERATEALWYLARNYPECAASEALHPHEDAAYQAAMRGDREGYLEALRSYMRAGKTEALRIRRGAA
jgi:ribonuclease HI